MKNILIWFTNVILKLFLHHKRRENLWIFGAWSGESYGDNSKYLFEYVNDTLPDIEAVWITKSQDIKEDLIESGYNCLLSSEKKGIKARLMAGTVFYTNGLNDVGSYHMCSGAKIVALWHGMPLKKLMYASKLIDKTTLKGILKYYYYKSYHNTERSFSIATSENTRDFIKKSFEVCDKSVLLSGQPRNDIFFKIEKIYNIKKEMGLTNNERIILYMPTWRDFGKEDKFLNTVIRLLSSDADFVESLEKNNIRLFIKPHPRVKISSKNKCLDMSHNINILESGFEFDSQELLAISDMLITDYSSAFIDYSILNRPIHFYTPDIEEYKKYNSDIFVDFESFSNLYLTEISELKNVILNRKYDEKGMLNSSKARVFFNDDSMLHGNYSERVIESLFRV